MLDRENLYRIASGILNPIPHILSIEDLVQEGYLATLGAERRFQKDRNVPLAAWLAIRARGAMIDAIRRNTPGKRNRTGRARPIVRSLDEANEHHEDKRPLDPPDDSWSLQLEIVEREKEVELLIPNLLKSLTPREWEVISRHYFLEEPLYHIAEDWGVSGSRVSQIHSKALARMRTGVAEVAA